LKRQSVERRRFMDNCLMTQQNSIWPACGSKPGHHDVSVTSVTVPSGSWGRWCPCKTCGNLRDPVGDRVDSPLISVGETPQGCPSSRRLSACPSVQHTRSGPDSDGVWYLDRDEHCMSTSESLAMSNNLEHGPSFRYLVNSSGQLVRIGQTGSTSVDATQIAH
jgi:hypothetical protein